jgi:hypothetical protein
MGFQSQRTPDPLLFSIDAGVNRGPAGQRADQPFEQIAILETLIALGGRR